MIIVSQDKTELVNFDKIESIWICPDEEGRFTLEATADTNATLGYYKTEERAKEVLNEIIKTYLEFTTMTDRTGTHVTIIKNKPKAYIMPEAGE